MEHFQCDLGIHTILTSFCTHKSRNWQVASFWGFDMQKAPRAQFWPYMAGLPSTRGVNGFIYPVRPVRPHPFPRLLLGGWCTLYTYTVEVEGYILKSWDQKILRQDQKATQESRDFSQQAPLCSYLWSFHINLMNILKRWHHSTHATLWLFNLAMENHNVELNRQIIINYL